MFAADLDLSKVPPSEHGARKAVLCHFPFFERGQSLTDPTAAAATATGSTQAVCSSTLAPVICGRSAGGLALREPDASARAERSPTAPSAAIMSSTSKSMWWQAGPFEQWVQEVLISVLVPPLASVCELMCGSGKALGKWQRARLAQYVGIGAPRPLHRIVPSYSLYAQRRRHRHRVGQSALTQRVSLPFGGP